MRGKAGSTTHFEGRSGRCSAVSWRGGAWYIQGWSSGFIRTRRFCHLVVALIGGVTLPVSAEPVVSSGANVAPEANLSVDDNFERKLVATESVGSEVDDEEDSSCFFCFFEKGATDDYFSGKVELTKARPINVLNPILGEPELEGQSKDAGSPSAEKIPESDRDRIMREFGKPEEDDAILGDEKAPKPFKAMMHALQAGDKELAFQYARRYARYMNNFRERSGLAARLHSLGNEIEGYQPRQDHSEESDPSGFMDLYRKEMGEAIKNESEVLAVNPEAQALLDRARGELSAEAGKPSMGSARPTASSAGSRAAGRGEKALRGEAAERALVRENHPRGVPVDPEGKVTVYFFLSSAELGPMSMIGDVQRLFDRYERDPNIRVQGISFVPLPELNVRQLLRYNVAVTFPIEHNREFATSLGVDYTPAVAVVAETLGKAVLEKGHRTVWYLDELVQRVAGRRGN